MIRREHYIEKVRPFYESDLIKIITGIRRCGKSVIMEQIINEISAKTSNIIYLNFEDKKVSANINNAEQLITYVEENKKNAVLQSLREIIENTSISEDEFNSMTWINWPLFTVGLVQRGFTDEEIQKIIGGNVRRVAEETLA